jgi:hypothetical protein
MHALRWRSAVQQSGGPQADVEALDEYLDIQAQLDALQLQVGTRPEGSAVVGVLLAYSMQAYA